jgi:alpha-glucosidase
MAKNWKIISVLFLLLLNFKTVCAGSEPTPRGSKLELTTVSESRSIPGGIEVKSGAAVMQIVALRDDVLRIRASSNGIFPEDASWAVLSDSRKQSVSVISETGTNSCGFRTKALRVVITKPEFGLRILDLDGNVLQEDAKDWPSEFANGAFATHKSMPDDEHYYGLGDKAGPLDRRNQSFTLWNSDTYSFQESTDPIYKSIPFFLAVRNGRAIGVLFDNTWRTNFDFGKQLRGVYSFGSEGGPADYYVLYGPDTKQVLTAYAWLTGPTPLPPLWTLGYQQSRYSYGTEAELRGVADRLRKDRIPADVLFLDIDFQDKNRPFTVNPERFPNFPVMLGDLKKQNFHVVAITDLHIADAPGAGYVPFDSGIAGDHFVKNSDGTVYVGEVWPGPSVFPDFTQRSTRDWWGSLYRKFVADGVAGFWNDMNEPSVFRTPTGTMPTTVQHRIDEPGFERRTATHAEIHNVFGMENSRATYEGLSKIAPEQRPFVLTRATFAGGQRYAATWTGDNSSTWNHLRLTVPMLVNLGLSGFGMSGADVGGFIGSPQPDLLTKWTELGTFQPIDRNHTEKGTAFQEPWVHGEAHESIRRRYIEERYRLLPYIYTSAEEMSRTGWPIMRPLFMEFPNAALDNRPLDTTPTTQFLFGADLLVAPPPYPDKTDDYQVRLPAVGWYDYWTGQRVAKAGAEAKSTTAEISNITIHPTLELLPVFVREGAIIPIEPLTQSTEETPIGPLTLRVYPGRECRGDLYLDDGKTMAFKRGEFLRMEFTCEQKPSGVRVHIGAHQGTFRPWWKQLQLEVYGWQADKVEVVLNNTGKPTAHADLNKHVAIIEVPDEGKGADLEISAQ